MSSRHPSSRPDPVGTPGTSFSAPRVERSAGGVVVRAMGEDPRVLLIRDPYRKWGLPKGHLEGEEGPEEAALREVREETGLQRLLLGPDLGEIDWVFRLDGRLIHKFCRFYLMGSADGTPRPEVSEGITECRWMSTGEALRMVAYANAREILRRAVARLHPTVTGDGPIWREE